MSEDKYFVLHGDCNYELELTTKYSLEEAEQFVSELRGNCSGDVCYVIKGKMLGVKTRYTLEEM